MNNNEKLKYIMHNLLGCACDVDNYGQIVIYTNLMYSPDGDIVTFTTADEDSE